MLKRGFIGVLALLCPALAFAADLSVKVEPAVAIPLSSPQSDLFRVGGGGAFKALVGLSRYLDIGVGVGAFGLPTQSQTAEGGSAWTAGGGLRLKRPHDAEGAYGISPWIDADLLYVRTGPLNRVGYDVGAGLAIPVGEARAFWVGPFVRYFQTVQPNRAEFDNRDAKILFAGISFEFEGTSGHQQPAEPVPAPIAEPRDPLPVQACLPVPVPPQSDRDGDGSPDSTDRCPDAAGPIDNQGCPVYEKIAICDDKIELREKIFFAWDKATIEVRSHPLLDEVAKALKDNKTFQINIDGHTDSSGQAKHNQKLSESRARAVMAYLVKHGIAKERLRAKGFGSAVPLESNGTVDGREKNRRVEFVIVKSGSAQ
jgi:outer membrane protein OmpA-like peptidoglycan-associated protein